jgi:SAM-dependent methyltransferase
VTVAVKAETHPPEYLLHRYWSRKPHNILAGYVQRLVPPGGSVVDPFCGSGVFLSEAARAGAGAVGFDVNPVAVLLSRVTLAPPPLDAFAAAAEAVLADLAAACADAYDDGSGDPVRYVVHETVAACPGCAADCRAGTVRRAGRTYRCSECGTRVHLNLRSLRSTHVRELISGRGVVSDPARLASQEIRSGLAFWSPRGSYSHPFAENRRILAYEGMETADLFSARNFSLNALAADRIAATEDAAVRDALLLMLTATVAQCSRLIAYRGRMSSGGPAWSVPGFWVPPVHVEGNPALHLANRLKKFERGLRRLRERPVRASAMVSERDGAEALAELAARGERFDLVFFDPPYGDSVPFAEFSALYNSFLGRQLQADGDISVSDRCEPNDAWAHYRGELDVALVAARSVLKPGGRLLVTFNNHDDRAWQALFAALQRSDFAAELVDYQLPAVVPAKAQLAREGSYVGDFYCVYARAASGHQPTRSLAPIEAALRDAATSRGGSLPPAVARRVVASVCIEQDLAADLLSAAFGLTATMFAVADGRLRLLEPDRGRPVPALGSIVLQVARRLAAHGAQSWPQLCTEVATETAALGVADPAEVLSAAGGAIEVVGKRWRWSDSAEERAGERPALEL